jgi:hypothetical protein
VTHRCLGEIFATGQHENDQLFGTPPREKEERLPKGHSLETDDVVRRALQEAPADLPASEFSATVGIARVSAGATSSISSRQSRPRCGCATARPVAPSDDMSGARRDGSP